MNKKQDPRIFVIGFMGSDRKGLAKTLAKQYEYRFLDVDDQIEKKDGRSIQRICMMMGEHEYRNKEYEMLCLLAAEKGIVVSCGDGVILDEMNRDILTQNKVVVADADVSPEILWERAEAEKEFPYAFMNQSDIAMKKKKFFALYEQRKSLYNQFISRP